MRVEEEQDKVEKARAEQFIAETPRMQGIENVRVELGEDHSGDPSMWLVFRLAPEVRVDREWAQEFNKYAAVIQTRILHAGSARFPYTRLERAA